MLYWYQIVKHHQERDIMEHRHIIASIFHSRGFNTEVRDNAVIVSLKRSVSQSSVMIVLWDEEVPTDDLYVERWYNGSIKISAN